MSLKSIIKKCCPDFLLPVLRVPYRIAAWPYRTAVHFMRTRIIARRALKYLPYYQDELSKEILNDNNTFLMNGNNNIFMNRAFKQGWTYTLLKGFPVAGCWKDNILSFRDYAGCVVLYHNDMNQAEYTCNLLHAYNFPGGYRVMALSEFLRGNIILANELIVAAVPSSYFSSIKKFAKESGLYNDIAGFIWGKHEEIQYLDVFSPFENEIVVDAGAYDGVTAMRFLKWGKGKVKHIYSFEFDPASVAKCEENLRLYADKVTLIQKGTWDKDEVICTEASGGTGSSVISEGNTEVQLVSIDSELAGIPVTFIKMDVEGAELKSLIGAKNTIIKNHPRLAICVYHKPEDIYEIPKYILSLVPSYKFYLRRYDSHHGETVLYAYCE